MSDPLREPEGPDAAPRPDAELVPADDAVIGRAFRWSVLVLAAVGLLGALAAWWLGRSRAEAPGQAIEAAAPQEVERAADPPPVTFTDITAQAGITFVHDNGAYGDKLLPETMGGGGGFLDYDDDGDQDLLLVNSSRWPHRPGSGPPPTQALYQNDGRGRFRDVTAEVGLGVSFYGMGVAFGDYDGDGRVDLFFTALGENRLFRNLGGTFEETTRAAGVAGGPAEWSTGAAFFDYDNDRDLDLFVVNYVRWSKEIDFEVDFRLTGIGRAYGPPQDYQGTFPYLYRNDGGGRFTDVSAEAGIQVVNDATGQPVAKSLGLVPVDADRDGWLDLLVANDTVRNFFFHNRGDGSFEEVGEFYGLAYDRDGAATGAMGVDAGHFRNDRDLAFLIGNFANEMTSVYVSQGDPTLYADEAIGSGVGAPSRRMLTFGLVLFDYDLDGRLDLLQVNGHIESEIARVDPSQSYRQPAQLFWNAGPGASPSFVPVPPEATGDLGRPLVGRGAAYADIDGDGDLDAVVMQAGGPALLLRNDQALGHRWLRLELVGGGGNRDAIGARVELAAGGVTQVRHVNPTRSYLSQVELPVTFGLGTLDRVDSLVVTWPDGTVETVDQVRLGELQVITQER